jgi:hypothetical protein
MMVCSLGPVSFDRRHHAQERSLSAQGAFATATCPQAGRKTQQFKEEGMTQQFVFVSNADLNRNGRAIKQSLRDQSRISQLFERAKPGMFVLLAICALLLISPSTCFAQSGATSTVVGHVSDTGGAVVQGAKVTITEVATGVNHNTVTSSTGEFTVPSLKPAMYQITVTSPGFETQAVSGVELVVGQASRVDVTLKPGNATETVHVDAQAVNLDTENAAVGQLVSQQEVVDLPLNGRNFTELLTLSSGASQNSGEQGIYRANEGNALSIQGSRPSSQQYFLDGVNINDVYYQTPAVIPSIDALQEFQIQTKGYSAAYGGGANQINLSTKSGTRNLHGTAFDFLRNNDLDARNYFDTGILPLHQNQFGYTLGGPILIPKLYDGRNKNTFFFANYEGLRASTDTSAFAVVPTQAEQGGLFPSTETIVDPVTKIPYPGNQIPNTAFSTFGNAVLSNNFYPTPNINSPQGNFRYTIGSPVDSDQQTYRFDQGFGSKDTVFARYTQTEYVTSSVPMGGFTQEQSHLDEVSHGVVANWTRTISPTKVNQFRFGWLHENVTLGGAPTTQQAYQSFGLQNIFPYSPELALPYVEIRTNQYSGAGGEPNVPQIYDQPSYQLSDAFTWSRGRQSISAGLDVRWFNGLNLTYTGIALTFDGSFTGDPFADLLVGYAAEAQAQQATAFGPTVDTSNEVDFYAKQFAPWVQDDWQVTPRLTVNAGLRWDYATRPVEGSDRTFWIDPNIPGGGLYVGSKKIIDEGLGGSVYAYGGQRAPGKNQYNVFAPRFGLAYRPFDDKSVIRAGYGIFYDSAESKEANGGAEYPFGLQSEEQFVNLSNVFPAAPALQPATNADMSFLFLTSPNLHTPYVQTWTLSAEREVLSGVKAEVDYIGSKADHLLGRVWENAPTQYDPANPTPVIDRVPYPNIGQILDHFWAFYSNYNSLSFKLDRTGKSLSFLVNYTWAHSLDDKSGSTGINADTDGNGPMNEYNFKMDYSSSSFDVRNRFVGSVVYSLPFGKGQRFAANTGALDYLIGGWQFNGILSLQSGEPFTTSATDIGFLNENYAQRADIVGNPDPSGFHKSKDEWFNTAAFAQPAIGAFGNASRNDLRAPGSENLDASIFKNTKLGDRVTWQTRLEAFNSFNHTNFGFPDGSITSPTYGAISSASPARVVQVAMKMIW